MTIPSGKLIVKRSTLPGAGKGLFTKVFIPKGTFIVEYEGDIRTWNEVKATEADNNYLMFVTRNHVVDAMPHSKALARYANDARGVLRIKGIVNNADYQVHGLSVFIVATKNIAAGSEIFVDYGKGYWKVLKQNLELSEK